MIGPIEQFLWGLFGSIAAEIVPLVKASRSDDPLPEPFHKISHWLARSLVAIAGGLMAVAAQAQHPLLAVHIGVTAPLVLSQWQRKLPLG